MRLMDGTCGVIRQMSNTVLIDEGINNDTSTYRFHVCPIAGNIYAFTTKSAIITINSNNYQQTEVITNGIVTAIGYKVPVHHLSLCNELSVSGDSWIKYNFKAGEKGNGKKAEKMVEELINNSEYFFPAKAFMVTDKQGQFAGIDIYVKSYHTVQVKLDYRGGRKPKGTGNLFIQIKECNPKKIYK